MVPVGLSMLHEFSVGYASVVTDTWTFSSLEVHEVLGGVGDGGVGVGAVGGVGVGAVGGVGVGPEHDPNSTVKESNASPDPRERICDPSTVKLKLPGSNIPSP